MPRTVNPRSILPPASRYAHGIVHSARARRLVISGQTGAKIDGSVPAGFAPQCEQIWDNIDAILRDAGMTTTNLIRITVYSTEPGAVGIYRAIRDRRLGGHLVAATYLEVSGLANPEFLVEIEAEAVCEEPDLAFLDYEAEAGDALGSIEGHAQARAVTRPDR
jgi:2-iminobutanoate/2-iminopropanoate deaminase